MKRITGIKTYQYDSGIDIETYEHLMKRDENTIDSLIETFMDDIENNIEDADLAADATDIIERLNNLRKEG